MEAAPIGWMALVTEGLRPVLEAALQEVVSDPGGKPKWVDFASGFQAIVTAVAILLGGTVAAFSFRLFRETASKADFQVRDSSVIRSGNRQVMYVNVLLANRARTRLTLERVDYKWHAVTARETSPALESYSGPRKLIREPQDMEPGKEAWGVVQINLPNDALGVYLWVTLHRRKRVGIDWLLARSGAVLRRKAYEDPDTTVWTFFVPVKEEHMQEFLRTEWQHISAEDDLRTLFLQGSIDPPGTDAAGLVIRAAERAVDVGWYGKRRLVAASLHVGEPANRTEIAAIEGVALEELPDGQYRMNGFRATGIEEGWLTIKLTFEDGLRISTSVELR